MQFIQYINSEAQSNDLTPINSYAQLMFPDFIISDPKPTVEGVELTIKGKVNSILIPLNNSSSSSILFIPGFPYEKLGLSFLKEMIGEDNGKTSFDFTAIYSPGAKQKITLKFPVCSFSIQLDKNKLVVNQPEIKIVMTIDDGPSWKSTLSVDGIINVELFNNQSVQFKANCDFTVSDGKPSSVQVGLEDNIKNGIKTPSLLGNSFTLNSVGGTMGVIFEPPGCLVGVELQGVLNSSNIGGTIQLKQSAIVCDVEGDVIIPLYLSFGLDKITFKEFLQLLTGGIPWPNLPISFIEPEFTYCEKPVALPDGTLVSPGFSFCSTFSFFGQEMYGKFDYTEDEKLIAKFQSSKDIGIKDVITISGNAKAVEKKEGISNSVVPTTESEKLAIDNSSLKTIFPSGGVEFSLTLDKTEAPELSMDARLKFLDIPVGSVTGSMGKSGIKFHANLKGLTAATFTPNDDYYVADISFCPLETVKISSGFALGKLIPTYPFDASLTIKDSYQCTAELSLTLADVKISIASNIDLTYAMHANSQQVLLEELMMEEVNSDAIAKEFVKNPLLWIVAVKNKVIVPFVGEDMASFVIEGLVMELKVRTKDIATYIAQVQKPLNLVVINVTRSLASGLGLTQKETGDILFAIHAVMPNIPEYQPKEIAQAMKLVSNASSQSIASLFHTHNVSVSDAALALTSVFNVDGIVASNLLRTAGFTPKKILSGFKSLGSDFEKTVKQIEKWF